MPSRSVTSTAAWTQSRRCDSSAINRPPGAKPSVTGQVNHRAGACVSPRARSLSPAEPGAAQPLSDSPRRGGCAAPLVATPRLAVDHYEVLGAVEPIRDVAPVDDVPDRRD